MDPDDDNQTIVLGDEHDRHLRDALRGVLHEIGARSIRSSWGVGGSQELEILEADLDGMMIHVEAETYRGLAISGKARLVERIATLVKERLAKR